MASDKDEIYKKIFVDAINGILVKDIAVKYGYSARDISHILYNNYGLSGKDLLDLRNNRIINKFSEIGDINLVALSFDLPVSTISNVLSKNNISYKKTNPIVMGKAIKLYHNGMNLKRLSKEIGIDAGYLGGKLKDVKIKKQCVICKEIFETKKSYQKYCKTCVGNKPYHQLEPNLVRYFCNECGSTFIRDSSHQKQKTCSKYCQYLSKIRQSSKLYKTIIQMKQKNLKPIEIYTKLGISRDRYKYLVKNKHDYLDIPPLYWSSDNLVLKYNKWETSMTKVNLLLRARQGRKAFEQWQQEQNEKSR